MATGSVYKIKNKGYLIYGYIKSVSGFGLATDPFFKISDNDATTQTLVKAIKGALAHDDHLRLPDPKDWKENGKEYLQKAGLKSLRELDKATTICCSIEKSDDRIIFTPMKHAEKPDRGFINKSKSEFATMVPYTASDEEIFLVLQSVLSQCD